MILAILMKVRLVLLLSICTVNHVACDDWEFVEFPVGLLQPDFEAIEKYITKNPEHHEAVVRWPNEIYFPIVITQEGLLLIDGLFKIQNKKPSKLSRIFKRSKELKESKHLEGNLYFRKGTFYVHNKKTSTKEPISSEIEVLYRVVPIRSSSRKQYLSISYHSLDEIKEMIGPLYASDKNYLSSDLETSPPTFLATATEPYPYFVEYMMYNEKHTMHPSSIQEERKLRVLIGTTEDSDLVMSESVQALKLALCQDTNRLSVFQSQDLDARPLENVFAVRMESTGFLAEVKDSTVKMLSSGDLEMGNVSEHKIPANELLKKVRNVEPKYPYRRRDIELQVRPNNVDFQLQGHVLVKKLHVLDDGSMDQNCPLVIEYKAGGPNFLYGTRTTQKICTDDSKLWVDIVDDQPVPITEDITLRYS